MSLERGQVLIEPGAEVARLILPESGLVSLVLELPDGGGGEAGLIGHEGVVGLPALLGAPRSPFGAVVRVPGEAQTIAVGDLRMLADRSANLRSLVRGQALSAMVQAATLLACQASHRLEQRAARWLLTAADRVGPGFPLTQEDLASSLGARRPTVNGVLSAFQRDGLIRHARGQVAVADPARLATRSCGCHAVMRRAVATLPLGYAADDAASADGEASAG
jgi:CRP-like cAMP-binding protein